MAILGMHRSGTSAIAGFLAKAGFFAGAEAELLAAAEDNPKGFFERADVNELNDGILAELGGAWDKPLPRELVASKAPAWRDRVKALLSNLSAGGSGRAPVLKDPRISLLLPAWLPALDEGWALLLVDRSPLEVASSVRERDGRPLYVALALWQLYCAELLGGLAGRRVLMVRYDDFVSDPLKAGHELLKLLGEVLPAPALEGIDPALAGGFVSPDMRHHRAAPDRQESQEVLTVGQARLAEWLGGLPQGWVDLDPPMDLRAQPATALTAVTEYYDAMGDRYGMETAYDLERHKALHFEQATELKDQHITNLEGAVAGLRRQADQQATRLAELEEETASLRAANEALRAQLSTSSPSAGSPVGSFLAAAKRLAAK